MLSANITSDLHPPIFRAQLYLSILLPVWSTDPEDTYTLLLCRKGCDWKPRRALNLRKIDSSNLRQPFRALFSLRTFYRLLPWRHVEALRPYLAFTVYKRHMLASVPFNYPSWLLQSLIMTTFPSDVEKGTPLPDQVLEYPRAVLKKQEATTHAHDNSKEQCSLTSTERSPAWLEDYRIRLNLWLDTYRSVVLPSLAWA